MSARNRSHAEGEPIKRQGCFLTAEIALAVQNRQKKGERNRGAALRMGDIARTPFQGALSVVQSVRMPSIWLAGANRRPEVSTELATISYS
jgi:hypothetical protein